eukprot:3312532-Pyramimonas_sp.AAC.1
MRAKCNAVQPHGNILRRAVGVFQCLRDLLLGEARDDAWSIVEYVVGMLEGFAPESCWRGRLRKNGPGDFEHALDATPAMPLA